MNLSGISNRSILGKIMRFPLRFIPSQMHLPIIQGKLRSKKWIVGSSNHGCWLGTYEFDTQLLFGETVRRGSTVFDLGGHVGFYTLLSSVLVGNEGKVVVFEPVPRNLFYLKEHLRLNRISNVTVIEAAVSDKSGVCFFDNSPGSSMGHIASDGKIQVETVVLDELISKGKIPVPDFMKIDIEGAEMLALSGAKSMLAKHHPTIFLSTHGNQIHNDCCIFLRSLEYELHPIDRMPLISSSEILANYNNDQTHIHNP